MNFLIAAPAWGERHVWFLCNVLIPALHKCAEQIDGEMRFIVATDRPDVIERRFRKLPYGYHFGELGDTSGNPYTALSICHRDALSEAEDDEAIILACADMVPSIEFLAAIERRLETKKVVACCGVRALEGDETAPIGVDGVTLSEWAWEHRHPWIQDCLYGEGRTAIPAYVFFRQDGNVFLHAFHLHPVALRSGKGLRFRGTIDQDLLTCFAPEEVHVVTDPAEFALIEISPKWHEFVRLDRVITAQDIVVWAKDNADTMHRRMFKHRIHIAGKKVGHSTVPGQISALLT